MNVKLIVTTVVAGFFMIANYTWAASPTDIQYASKSGDTRVYNVRCSDGQKTQISSWDDRKTWCVGTRKKNCSNDQLKTAKEACK